MQTLLEIACFNERAARIAAASGADRIELCVDYAVGGTTPTVTSVQALATELSIPIFVMIRPRAGDFCYTAAELDTMCASIEAMQEAGAAGLVLGALTAQQQIDKAACQQLLRAAGALPCTFHRAFDLLDNPIEGISILQELGFVRILCSGGQGHAANNLEQFKKYFSVTHNNIIIVPGGGVRPDNIRPLLLATGAKEVHSAALNSAEPFNNTCDPAMIRLMQQQIKDLSI